MGGGAIGNGGGVIVLVGLRVEEMLSRRGVLTWARPGWCSFEGACTLVGRAASVSRSRPLSYSGIAAASLAPAVGEPACVSGWSDRSILNSAKFTPCVCRVDAHAASGASNDRYFPPPCRLDTYNRQAARRFRRASHSNSPRYISRRRYREYNDAAHLAAKYLCHSQHLNQLCVVRGRTGWSPTVR